MGQRLARSDIRYAEVTVTALDHLDAEIVPAEVAEALTTGRRQAADLFGIELAWVFDVSGELGPAAGEATLDWVVTHRPAGTVGFGLGGPEAGVSRSTFRSVFSSAR